MDLDLDHSPRHWRLSRSNHWQKKRNVEDICIMI